MTVVVFSDRDGTINKDEDYYLGSDPNWKNQVAILSGVPEGIKLINSIPDSKFFILTNQSGVALKGDRFDALTLERMHEVNKYIVDLLRGQGASINGYFACPYVDAAYVAAARKKGRVVDPAFVQDGCPDLKPHPGMLEKALASLSLRRDDCQVFMIGDRASDVEMGLNYGGVGILIESWKTAQLGDREKVTRLHGQTYIAKDFLDAARFIVRSVKN